MSQDQEQSAAEILERLMENGETNGLKAKETKRVRFDGTLSIGHILMIVSMTGALFTMYLNFHDENRSLEVRVGQLEKTVSDIVATQKQGMENQTTIGKALDRITWTMEQQQKQKP